MRLSRLPVLAAIAAVSACGFGSTAPDGAASRRPGASLDNGPSGTSPTFLEAAATAPTIANPVVSFWARRGVDTTVTMLYTDGATFMRFRVRKKSLAFYPNGQPFAQGDSVLITATLIDPVNLVVDFQPAGLVFSAGDPANLKLSYADTDPDWNNDGVVDQVDSNLQRYFQVWQQHDGLPWMPLVSKVSQGIHEVEASLGGFTHYAVAY